MKDSFRLSRIRQPRATLATMLLLAAVFIAFGVFADQTLPSDGSSAQLHGYFETDPAWQPIQSVFNSWSP